MLKNNDLITPLIKFALLINSATLLIPNKFKAYSIALLLILCVVKYTTTGNNKVKYDFKKVYTVSILLFLYLFSILYSFCFKEGFNRVSTMSSLLAFPIGFGLLKSSSFYIDIKFIKKIFFVFIFSNILFCFFSFFYVWSFDDFTITSTFIHYSNSINKDLGLLSIHPIYLSLYTGISILMLFFLMKLNYKQIKFRLLYFTLIVFLGIVLAILMRKGSIIYIFISVTFLVYKLFDIKKTLLTLLILLIVTIISIQFLPKYKNINRFNEILNNEVYKNPNNSTGIRYSIYKCSLEKIKENFFIGYGVGNTQNQLDPCYLVKGIDLSLKTYNSHNQYFSILLTVGFFGLCIYLIYVFKIIKIFNKNKNYLANSLLLFFLLNFFTENIIERENGIILYSFFISLFLFYEKSLETKS